MTFNTAIKMSLLIYDLQSEDWINTYYMLKSFPKACRPPKVSNEMKCTNEKMTWNTQDTNLSSYVPKANVDHTISGQGTGISTLDHSATTQVQNDDFRFILKMTGLNTIYRFYNYIQHSNGDFRFIFKMTG